MVFVQREFRAAIFDLDGVLVDTAKYHYLAWKQLAAELGFDFSEADNERLKGVSRMRSLDILLDLGGIKVPDAEKHVLADRKNRRYVALLKTLDPSALLPGAKECLCALYEGGVPVALASASRNAGMVIEKLRIAPLLRYVVDAAGIANAKPSPDIFLEAARGLGVAPAAAVVFEDAAAGIKAAHAAGMIAVGIGTAEALPSADVIAANLSCLDCRTANGILVLGVRC
jgi:beta-phosphoglucomutase